MGKLTWSSLKHLGAEAVVIRYRKDRITMQLVEMRLRVNSEALDVPFADFWEYPIFRIPACLAWKEHVLFVMQRDGIEMAGVDAALVIGDGRGMTLGSR